MSEPSRVIWTGEVHLGGRNEIFRVILCCGHWLLVEKEGRDGMGDRAWLRVYDVDTIQIVRGKAIRHLIERVDDAEAHIAGRKQFVMPHVENFRVRPCSFCMGDAANWNTICDGCGGWSSLWWFDGRVYCGPFDPETGRIRPWKGCPSVEMVLEDLGRWAKSIAHKVCQSGTPATDSGTH